MTLVVAKPMVLRKGWQPMDTDAAAYITAVETADGQALEEKTKIAIDNFVLGCKADGIWTAIKASCILAGARTLSGALVPLVGAAPTNNNFVSGDYNRETGLAGNGSTKYLDSNRLASSDPQNNFHMSVLISTAAPSGVQFYMGGSTVRNNDIYRNSADISFRSRTASTPVTIAGVGSSTGFMGHSRSDGSSLTVRVGQKNILATAASAADTGANIYVFARNTGSANSYTSGRLAFYSIGESLDLALLDTRVTDLINAIGAAF